MKIADLINITEGMLINKGDIETRIKDIVIDSRKVTEGDLFIALKGQKYDGHDFIDEVITKNVSGIIVDKEIDIPIDDIPIIKVNNTYDSLIKIASYIRNKYDIPLIAITGSVGKTTTKELIYNILSTKYNVLKSINNNNNHIGLPLTLFNLKKEHEIIVTELGMNHFGELKKLSNICKPNVAVITNIGTAHIGNLGSKRNIFKAKMEILDGMDEGNIVINGDDKYLNKLDRKKYTKKFKIYKCGYNDKNHLYAFNIKCDFEKTTFNIKVLDEVHKVTFNVPGKHLIPNILLAIQVGLLYGINIKHIIKAISEYKTLDKRMDIIKLKKNNTLIADCYNSSYESLIGVLELIKNVQTNKLIILGDILELGKYSKKIHLKIGKYLKKMNNTMTLLVGKEMKVIKGATKHFDDNESLIKYLEDLNFYNSIILIKGSRKLHLEEIKEYLEERY